MRDEYKTSIDVSYKSNKRMVVKMKNRKNLSAVTLSIIEQSARNDTPIETMIEKTEKPIEKIDLKKIDFSSFDFSKCASYSFKFVNVRADNDRVRLARAIELVNDRLLCIAAKRLYTFSLSELREQILTAPLPKNSRPDFSLEKFARDVNDRANPDYLKYRPVCEKSRFFADYREYFK